MLNPSGFAFIVLKVENNHYPQYTDEENKRRGARYHPQSCRVRCEYMGESSSALLRPTNRLHCRKVTEMVSRCAIIVL